MKSSLKKNIFVDFNVLVTRWGPLISNYLGVFYGCHVSFKNHIMILSSALWPNLGQSIPKLSRNPVYPSFLPLFL